jgi:hypothetical protein
MAQRAQQGDLLGICLLFARKFHNGRATELQLPGHQVRGMNRIRESARSAARKAKIKRRRGDDDCTACVACSVLREHITKRQ